MKDDDPASTRLALLAVLGLVALAYLGSLDAAFVFDDVRTIVQSPRTEPTWENVRRLVGSTRWVVQGTFILNRAASGLSPRGWHVVNLGVHLAAVALVFALARRTLGRREPAFAVALLWGVHPLTTEAVTYVSQRAQSLMSAFELLFLWAFVRGVGSPRRTGWHALSIGAYFLGVFTKAHLVLAPLLALLYERAFLGVTAREALRRHRWFYAALGACWAFGVAFILVYLARKRTDVSGDPLAYLATQGEVIPYYLWLSVWPAGLCIDHGWPAAKHLLGPGAVAVAALIGATLWAHRRAPGWSFLGAWFILNVAPTSSVIPRPDACVEHRVYLPLVAVVAAAVVLGRRWLPGRAAAVVVALAALTLGARTWVRNLDYASNLTLWRSAVARAPESERAFVNLGTALVVEAKDPAAAVAAFTRALELRPLASTYRARAGALAKLGRLDEAIRDLERASARYERLVLLNEARRFDEALAGCDELLAAGPRADVLVQRGIALQGLGRAEALAAYDAALTIDPACVPAVFNRGTLHLVAGRWTDAERDFTRVIELAPGKWEAWQHRAYARASLGRLDEARADARQVERLGGRLQPALREMLRQ